MGSLKGVPRGKYKSHIITHIGNVHCSQCGKTYKRRTSLLQHINSKHHNKKISCVICLKKYSAVSVLKRHLRKVCLNFLIYL